MSTAGLTETALLLRRSLRHIQRSPDTVLTTAVTPVAMLLLFVYVLGGAIQGSPTERGNYVDYLLPGILIVTIASGVAYTAFRIFTDISTGIVERFQAMPIARSCVLWSHVLTSVIANLVSLALVTGVAVLTGFRSSAGLAAWSGVVALLVLVTFALTWMAVIPGLTAVSVDGVSGFSYPLIFLPFVSSAFVPTEGMPGPVRAFAQHQPVTPIVDTLRNLLSGTDLGAEAWQAVAWCAGLLVLAYLLAMRSFRRKFA